MNSNHQICPHCGNYVQGQKVKSYTNKVTRQGAKSAAHMVTSAGGMTTGAAIGSAILPGVGTVVGGAIGFIGSAMFNQKVNESIDSVGDVIEDNFLDMEYKFVCPKCGHQWISSSSEDYNADKCCSEDDIEDYDLSRFKAFFDSYLNDEYANWSVEKRASLFEHEGEICNNEIVKSMYFCVAAVIRLETFFEEWMANQFKNYIDSQHEFQQICIEKGFSDIQISRDILPEDKEYLLISGTLCMLSDFWLEDCREEAEIYTETFGDLLNIEAEENAIFSHEWLSKIFKYSYEAILDYINTVEKEYIEEVISILEDYGEIGPRERKRLEKDRIRLGISEQRAQELENDLSNTNLTEEEKEYLEEFQGLLEDYGTIGDKERKRLEKIRVRLELSEARVRELEML